MNFKRILAGILAASVLSTSALAFTPYIDKEESEAAEEQESSDSTEQEESEESKSEASQTSKPSSYLPKDYYYILFRQILETYVENHLYDFTEEEVLYAFFEDFLNDNPMYFPLIMEYVLGTMDPYSTYHSPASNAFDKAEPAIGFGFMIAKDDDGGVKITDILKDSSAEAAGIRKGDEFVSIAGINVENLPYEAVTIILAQHAKVTAALSKEASSAQENTDSANQDIPCPVVVRRGEELISAELYKGPITAKQIYTKLENNHDHPTAYIQFERFFGDGLEEEFVSIVEQYANDGIKNLTLDLRDNGGGSIDIALSMVECFIPEGDIICYYKDKSLTEPKPIYSTTNHVTFDSITILINENTASAAELMTNILVTKGLAKTVGAKTFGKSLGQTVFSLKGGGYITVTSYQMLDENLQSYDGIGITPDIAIENVEMCYTLPTLGAFSYLNYTQIKEGEYSEVTKALEDRLCVMGFLFEKDCDGIFDETTKTALMLFQIDRSLEASGFVDLATVDKITEIINLYKTRTYYEDSQLDVAYIIHRSFSQGKRLRDEKERLRKKQAQLIEERDAALEAQLSAAE